MSSRVKTRVQFLNLNRLYQTVERELEEAYHRVMSSGYYILGPEVESFEYEFAKYCGAKYCLGVSSGLEALVISLRALGISEGDEVIVPSHTFIATWLAVTQVGATIIPVEVSETDYNIDVHKVKSKITKRTKAIIPVHLYGAPADMDPLIQLARDYGLYLIEDNAQAQGATYKLRPTGSLGDLAATSFYPGKNLGAFGDGGAITTNDSDHAQMISSLRNYGAKVKYHHEYLGSNTRLDELQAAFLRVKLKYLDRWNQRRSEVAQRYNRYLTKKVRTPNLSTDICSSWHLYVIRTPERDKLIEYLNYQGIDTGIHYPIPPHKQQCYDHLNLDQFEISESISDSILSLPIGPCITEDEQDRVIEAINRCLD